MITADEAKQIANACRDERTLAANLIERIDRAIHEAAERDGLARHFTVITDGIPPEIVANVANRYRCTGWAVSISTATTEPGWLMRIQA